MFLRMISRCIRSADFSAASRRKRCAGVVADAEGCVSRSPGALGARVGVGVLIFGDRHPDGRKASARFDQRASRPEGPCACRSLLYVQLTVCREIHLRIPSFFCGTEPALSEVEGHSCLCFVPLATATDGPMSR